MPSFNGPMCCRARVVRQHHQPPHAPGLLAREKSFRFTGIARPEEFRTAARTLVIAWRGDMVRRGLGGSTARHLCECKRRRDPQPAQGRGTAQDRKRRGHALLGDHQPRRLLARPTWPRSRSGWTYEYCYDTHLR